MSKATQKQVSVLNDSIKLARSSILDAIKADAAVAGKWTVAAQRLQDAYGPKTFLTSKEEGFDKDIATSVKTLLSDCIGVPSAPSAAEDASDEGKALRAARQSKLVMVNVYLARMKKYVSEDKSERASAGTPKSPKEVFSTVAKRIRNLYFGTSQTVNKAPSPKFGRDIQCLATALETMATANIPFSTAWDDAVAKFDGLDESAKAAVAATPAAKTPPKGRSKAASATSVQ